MRYSSLIGHAAEALEKVRASRLPADAVMQEFFAGRRYLGARDRREIAAMVYDVLRHLSRLRAVWSTALGGAPAPMLGLLFVRAVVVGREEADRLAAGFDALWRVTVRGPALEAAAAAVREAERQFAPPADPVERLALEHSLPQPVVRDWVERYGEAGAGRLCAASNQGGPTTIRVNTLQCTVEECRAALAAEGVEAGAARYSPVGLVLSRRMHAPGLQAFRRGWFELQDEGSQLLSYLVRPRPGQTVIDACAGGGGKTLHLAALMENAGSILALDVAPERLRNLRERAGRAGVRIVTTELAGPGRPPASARGTADAVLIDAPCTGTGTFRRNPGAKSRWDAGALESLARTQRRLLEGYAASVRPGGRLVYATCSLLERENMQQVREFLASHGGFRLVPAAAVLAESGITVPSPPGPALELLPHLTGTDGFFAAVLERVEDAPL